MLLLCELHVRRSFSEGGCASARDAPAVEEALAEARRAQRGWALKGMGTVMLLVVLMRL